MVIKEAGFQQNCIIARNFNTTLHQNEKKGGSIVRDPFREHMEDMVFELDLFDVHPSKGKYMWSKKCTRVGHIPSRLDILFIHSLLLSLLDNISFQIIPWGLSDYRPIALSFHKS
jgi:hypothetical protein